MRLKCKHFLLLAYVALLAGCASSPTLQRGGGTGGGKPKVEIIAASKAATPKPLVCDMRVQVKVTDPIAPYLSDFGIVTVRGKEGFRVSKSFPVKYGTQVVVIEELEAERYDVEVTYGDIIATKCVILGCLCQDNWKEVFAMEAAEEIMSGLQCTGCGKYGYSGGKNTYWQYGSGALYRGRSGGYWGQRGTGSAAGRNLWTTTQTPELKGSGEQDAPCSQITPCGRNVSFELPKDSK